MYILPDKYHKGIHSTIVSKNNKINSEMIAEEGEGSKVYYNYSTDEADLFAKVITWYQEHAKDINLQKLNFAVLTSDEKLLARKQSLGFDVISMVSFLKTQNSNLLDFIGFEDITN